MKFKFLWVLLVVLAVSANLTALLLENALIEQISYLCFILGLFGIFFGKLPAANLNFYGFFTGLLIAAVLGFFHDQWYFIYVSSGFWIFSLFFLIKEAIRFTEYRRGSRLVQLYFVVVVSIYAYLLSNHILEIEESMTDNLQLVMYLIYYLNLLILGITALVYYLNSFSRKSVYFICFALALIFSDVLRDMGVFYFRDLSVELVGGIIKSAALLLSFLFFVTKEKKLRLLNLV